MTRHILLSAILLAASPALAAEHSQRCTALEAAKKTVAESHGVWIGLTSDQLQFLRGVSATHPQTPIGIPLGDAAAMATLNGQDKAIVFFIDGERACDMMVIPDSMHKLVLDIGLGVVKHEGEGM